MNPLDSKDRSYMSKQEVADLLCISPKVLTVLMRRRMIPYVKLSQKSIIFRRSMVEKAMEEMERKAKWQ